MTSQQQQWNQEKALWYNQYAEINQCHSVIIWPVKICFKNKSVIKAFSDKQKPRMFHHHYTKGNSKAEESHASGKLRCKKNEEQIGNWINLNKY